MTTKQRLVVWHEFDGPGDTSIQVLEELCAEYSRLNDIEVVPEVMNISELIDRLKKVSNSGATAHMAFVPADLAVLDKQALYSRVPEQLSDIVEGFGNNDLASMEVEGVPYGVPIIKGNHMVLYYNREIYKTPPASWQDIELVADQLKERGIVPMASDLKDPYWFIPLFTAFGGWPIQDGKPAIINESMKQALHFASDQMEAGNIACLNGSTDLLERFIAGEVGAIVCGEWIFNYLDQQVGNKLGVASLPSITGIPSISFSSSIGLVFPNRSIDEGAEMREEVLDFVKFMLSEESQRKWGTKVQRIPVHSGVQQQLMSTYSSTRADLVEQLNNSKSMPIEHVMNDVWIALGEGMKLLLTKGANDAFLTMEQVLNESSSRRNSSEVTATH